MNNFLQRITSSQTWNGLLELIFYSLVLIIVVSVQLSMFLITFLCKLSNMKLPHSVERTLHQLNLMAYDISEYLCGNSDTKPKIF